MYRKQKVIMDGIRTEFVDINRGVPQGTVLGLFWFHLLLMILNLSDLKIIY